MPLQLRCKSGGHAWGDAGQEGRTCVQKIHAHKFQIFQLFQIVHPKPVGLFGLFRWTCSSRHPKNLDFPAPKNPHKKRARERRSPKSPDSPSKNGKNPAIWTCAAPPMKSPKTRERQAFRGLPFCKWDVGNRKCAGFHIKNRKGIRRNTGLRPPGIAGVPILPLALQSALHYAALRSGSLLRRQGSSPIRTSTGRPQGALTRHSRSTRAWGRVISKRKKCRTAKPCAIPCRGQNQKTTTSLTLQNKKNKKLPGCKGSSAAMAAGPPGAPLYGT